MWVGPNGALIHSSKRALTLPPTQVLSGLQRIAPDWSERLHFPNLQGHRREGASREPLSCQRGKAIQLEDGLWLLIRSQVTVLPRPFFHANGKSSNTVRKYISLGYAVIGGAFNMGTFTAKDLLEILLRGVKSTLSVQVWMVPLSFPAFLPVSSFVHSSKSILTPN